MASTLPGSGPGGPAVARRLVALALVLIAGYYAIWGGEYSMFDLNRLRERQRIERDRIEAGRAEVDSLRALAERLESDPATIERVARERFGLIRPGEVLYRFVEVDSVGEAAEEPASP